MAIAVTDHGDQEDTGTDSSTFTYGSIGGSGTVLAVAVLGAEDSANAFTVSSATIFGVAANVLDGNDGRACTSVILWAEVAAGSSGDIVVAWSEAITQDQRCTLLTLTGANPTAYDTAINSTASNNNDVTAAIDVPAGGIIIGCVAFAASGGSCSTLAVEDSNGRPSDLGWTLVAAHEIFGSAQTGYVVRGQVTGAGSTQKTLAAVSFAEDSGSAGSVSPPAANIAFAALAPVVSVTSSGAVAPPVKDIAFAALAPVVSIQSSGSVSPPAADIAFAALAPTVVGNASGAVTVPAANIALAALAPTVVGNQSGAVTVPAADIALAALAPTVVGNQGVTVNVPVADIAFAALAPTVVGSQSASVTVPAADIALAALAPAVVGNQSGSVLVPAGNIAFAALAPTVSADSTPAQEVIWGYRRRKKVKVQPPGKVVYQGVPQTWDDDDEDVLLMLLH